MQNDLHKSKRVFMESPEETDLNKTRTTVLTKNLQSVDSGGRQGPKPRWIPLVLDNFELQRTVFALKVRLKGGTWTCSM